ncbi:MAG: endonuclease/exonuclease/phosphatase family protein, partial [Candidatus Eremiobacterota bacterium]
RPLPDAGDFQVAPVLIRVASFNLMAPAGPLFPWADRPGRAADALGRIRADLVGTQEATPEALEVLERRLPDYAWLGRGRRPDGRGIQCALLYRRDRFRVLSSGHFWMSPTPEVPGSRFLGMGSCRVATWAVLEVDSRPLTWLNVHFSHLRRRRQARLVLERLAGLPRPWLLTGDFNGTPWPAWSSHRVLVGNGPFRDRPGGPTYPAPLPVVRLDWILATSELRCLGSRVEPSRASDHLPVVADFEHSYGSIRPGPGGLPRSP